MAFDHLTLNVLHRRTARSSGSVPVPTLTTGTHGFTWDGTVGGKRVADGQYLLQLVGTAGSKAYHAPSARPATPAQIAMYAVTVDTVAPGRDVGLRHVSADLAQRRRHPGHGLVRAPVDGRHALDSADRRASGRTRSGPSRAPAAPSTFTWNGRGDTGAVVPDGLYTVTLAACDVAGNCATRRTQSGWTPRRPSWRR